MSSPWQTDFMQLGQFLGEASLTFFSFRGLVPAEVWSW